MKITVKNDIATFDFENGYTISGPCEATGHREYAMYLDSLEMFDPPHEDEMITPEQLMEITSAGANPVNYDDPTISFD